MISLIIVFSVSQESPFISLSFKNQFIEYLPWQASWLQLWLGEIIVFVFWVKEKRSKKVEYIVQDYTATRYYN